MTFSNREILHRLWKKLPYFLTFILLLILPFVLLASESRIVIEQKDHKFSELFVKLSDNDILKFVNLDSVNHQLEFSHKGQHELMKEIEPGNSQEITFSHSGIYDVQCRHHPEMKLTVFIPHVVKLTRTDTDNTF